MSIWRPIWACEWKQWRTAVVVVSGCFLVGVRATCAQAATITVVDLDDAGEGLNDATPVLPEGGNPGTTLGEQRRLALQYAADRWGELLASDVEIRVGARFDPLGGDATAAAVGNAGPGSVHRDYPGAPLMATWYPAALANSLSGVDLDPSRDDVSAHFNSDVDGLQALGPRTFYYGFDSVAGADVDFVTVALHELAHGLGFVTFMNLGTGQKRACAPVPGDGCDDVYLRHLADDAFQPPDFPSMSAGQRVDASLDGPNLLWNGALVVADSGGLSSGVSADGRVEMYAPPSLEAGASVVHFSKDVSPDELMEPAYTAPNHDLSLTLAALRDVGWRLVGATTTTTTTTVTVTVTVAASTTTSTTATTVPPMPSCGDPNGDGQITATDALIVLRGAVGTGPCDPAFCDVDASGTVSASDAQRVLKVAVGQPVELACA